MQFEYDIDIRHTFYSWGADINSIAKVSIVSTYAWLSFYSTNNIASFDFETNNQMKWCDYLSARARPSIHTPTIASSQCISSIYYIHNNLYSPGREHGFLLLLSLFHLFTFCPAKSNETFIRNCLSRAIVVIRNSIEPKPSWSECRLAIRNDWVCVCVDVLFAIAF